MVKLLVTNTNVMIMAFNTVGENLKGVGQFGVALRKNPYATRQAANVIVSEMMNSHIAIFLDGIENGDDPTPPTV
jgi:hypothetical protein